MGNPCLAFHLSLSKHGGFVAYPASLTVTSHTKNVVMLCYGCVGGDRGVHVFIHTVVI